MNYRMILHIISHIMRIEALFMMPALGVSIYHGELAVVQALGISIALLGGGSLISRAFPLRTKAFYAREGFVIVGLVWIVLSIFGALPFFLSGEIPSFIDSLFETISGFTTTGASILTDVEAMSYGLLYWRSFTHWLGGMGVLVFLLALAPLLEGSGSSMHLLRAESPGPQVGKIVPRIRKTAKILYGLYIGMTLLQILLLCIGKIPLFDAVTIAFGTAGTGGFAIKNASIGGYSDYIQNVVTIFMALFGVNFNLYYLLMIKEVRKVFRSEELRVYLGVMLASMGLVALNIMHAYGDNIGKAFHHAAFQVASIMTTTGFATTDFDMWPQFSRMLLVVLMVLGASAGSTGGGIKIARVILLIKAAKRELSKMLHPLAVNVVHMDDGVIPDETLRGVYTYMSLYCTIAAISMLAISIDNFAFETNITAVLACLNNIGPGLGIIGPTGNYSSFSGLSKLVLSANMLLGRLELFPVLMLLMPAVWKRSLIKNES